MVSAQPSQDIPKRASFPGLGPALPFALSDQPQTVQTPQITIVQFAPCHNPPRSIVIMMLR